MCVNLRCAKRSAEMRIDMLIGNHLSASKGYAAMGKAALALDANTFAFFTRNPRGGKAKEIDEKDVEKFLNFAKEHEFGKIVAHAPYTMNLCAAKEDVRSFSKEMLFDDLRRMEYTPGNYYNFHPGSHVGQGADTGIELIAEALNEALKPDQTTTVLLETMAGKGTEVGRNFEELREILDRVELKEKMGVRWRILWYFISDVIVGAGCLSAMILGLDYEYHAVLIGYFLYIFHKKPVWAIPFCFLAMYKEPWALLGFGLTLTYNGERGRQNKIVNYFFYPVHLFVLGMIKMYFGF